MGHGDGLEDMALAVEQGGHVGEALAQAALHAEGIDRLCSHAPRLPDWNVLRRH